MKRIATTAVVVLGLAVPSVASASSSAQIAPQVSRQIVKPQLVRSQLVRPALVKSQLVRSQRAQALRFSSQLGLLRR